MVIDDDAPLLGFTAKYLTRLGYSVSACGSSEQAWREFNAAAAKFALVLMDLSLSGVPAAELSQRMLNANPALRLILMSGYPFDTGDMPACDRDRTVFLHKPFTPSTLAETVSRMIGAATGQ